jgi:hypothetical protein
VQLPDLKALNKLIALCRKQGVKVIKLGDMELTLSDDAPVKTSKKQEFNHTQGEVDTDSLTDEQLLMWSSTPNNEILKGDSQ